MGRRKTLGDTLREKLRVDPDLAQAVEEEAFVANVADQIYNARREAGLTQQELADRLNSAQSVIARLEDADYESHSLSMLRKIAEVLGKSLYVEFRPRMTDFEPSAGFSQSLQRINLSSPWTGGIRESVNILTGQLFYEEVENLEDTIEESNPTVTS